MATEFDYKKFCDVRKAVLRPLKYDLYVDGEKIVHARWGSLDLVDGEWSIKCWYPGNRVGVYVDVNRITYKIWNEATR